MADCSEVERLDFRVSPHGYSVDYYDGWWWAEMRPAGAIPLDRDGGNDHPLASEAVAVAAAWDHCKVFHDPPGLWTDHADDMNLEAPSAFLVGEAACGHAASKAEARAAAWTWYERRLRLADRVAREVVLVTEQLYGELNIGLPSSKTPVDVWPRVLTWSDEQCDEVERWLADPAAKWRPEVLRG